MFDNFFGDWSNSREKDAERLARAKEEAQKIVREVERRIKAAQRSGATRIDLSSMSLPELPNSLSNLTRLKSINLSNNYLKELPEWFSKFSQLQDLYLANNRFEDIPQSLSNLTNLQNLDISSNKLTSLPVWLNSFSQLQNLTISHNEIQDLPIYFDNLTNLQNLNLSHNLLKRLPEWLGKLTQLQRLTLSSNPINIWPEELSQLQFTQLQKLELFSCQLKTLPESLGLLTKLQSLDLSQNRLTTLPESLGNLERLQLLNLQQNNISFLHQDSMGNLKRLQSLNLSYNHLKKLPESLRNLEELQSLNLSNNNFTLPNWLGNLKSLKILRISANNLTTLPESIGNLRQLQELDLSSNRIHDLPSSLAQLEFLNLLLLDSFFLNPELTEAYKQGLDAIKTYLRAKNGEQITLNEAKLILVGEGEVGKSCLLGALRGDKWEEGRPTTHGIEIKPVKVIDADTGTEFTLNGWDFGGQRVYRPTHQLFFSAPAVYLVVWKPREGPQQGFVKEWIQLIKRREPDAKIIVVATHGGPQQRQPDIDRQELRDLFGADTVVGFYFIESKPNPFKNGERRGIEELKQAIARVASSLPEVGRSVPKSFQEVRLALQSTGLAYLTLERVLAICHENNMDIELARLFVTISHRLGHLIHYEHDPALRDIVVLKPDWLASAISFVLDDEATRTAHGLVRMTRLSHLWNDPARAADSRYSAILHPIFLRLMERFDLSYRVSDPISKGSSDHLSLIGQLVPDNRPEKDLEQEWPPSTAVGDLQQVQICRIVDAQNGQSASAEGLFYQMIVRLHKYSLGRVHYNNSIHWQRGLVLDDDYNGRALLEHIGNDVRIIVRAPYPERFLAMLTSEVKYLVESFWEGLRCEVMVPCATPCGKSTPGAGLFDVNKLIESKRKNRTEFPCPVCTEWQNIDHLLRNAPTAQPDVTTLIVSEFNQVKEELEKIRQQLSYQGSKIMGKFDRLDDRQRRTLSRVDKTYNDLLQVLTDEAKDGPRLFSLVPVKRSAFNLRHWTSAKFHLILWCEHSRWPLPVLNGRNIEKGIYEIELTREWFKKAAPFLKVMASTLSLVLPIAASGIKLKMEEVTYKSLEDYLGFGKEVIDGSLSGIENITEWIDTGETIDPTHGPAIRADGATLRELHTLLKAKDPGFGGLVRVMNKRQEFLWVHEKFVSEY